VLRLVKRVVDAAHEANIPVAMCGEMAGDPMCCLILLGLELDELSMNHLAIPRIKRIIRKSSLKEAKILLNKAMTFNAAYEVRGYVEKHMRQKFPEEFEKVED
jgi:phosphotransferase system enzyme I (PtsI)